MSLQQQVWAVGAGVAVRMHAGGGAAVLPGALGRDAATQGCRPGAAAVAVDAAVAG